MESVPVDIQAAGTDGNPVLYDISYLDWFPKTKFIPPLSYTLLVKQNSNYQQAYFSRSQGA